MITSEADIVYILCSLGISKGDVCISHTALSRFGYVINGPRDYIDAFDTVLGTDGTHAMSSSSNSLCHPDSWTSISLNNSDIEKITKSQKQFDPLRTPVSNRGIVPSYFISLPNTYRSPHPIKSIAASGSEAEYICSEHNLTEPEGLSSPLHKIYLLQGKCCLMGVDFTSASILHLAESLSSVDYLTQNLFSFLYNDSYVRLTKYPINSAHFNRVLSDTQLASLITTYTYHLTQCVAFPVKPFIDRLVAILNGNPSFLL